MIGDISEPHRPERCNRCRHWVEDMATRDPADDDWGFGECRQAAPVLVSSMVGAQLDKPRFGQQDDLNVDLLHLQVATRFPVTSATDWCGRYEPKAAHNTLNDRAGDHDEKLFAAFTAYRSALDDYRAADPKPGSESPFYARMDEADGVLVDCRATSSAGVSLKLRRAFAGIVGEAWSDDALGAEASPDFVRNVALADVHARMLWSAVEDLERVAREA